MDIDDELCLCFHITRRKVETFIRVEQPRVASQLSECGGAGTGCGWCRPFLQKLLEASKSASPKSAEFPEPQDYRRERANYVQAGGGTPPPGAEI